MSKFYKFVAATIAVLGLALAVTPSVQAGADIYDRLYLSRTVAPNVIADDSDTALFIVYTGTKQSGTVQISTTNILFKEGASGSETNTGVGFKCPGGGTEGTIDVTNAACDTVGEVLNVINASTNFRAIPVDALLADTVGTSQVLKTLAATKANTGVKLNWLTASKFQATRLLSPWRPDSVGPAVQPPGFWFLQGDRKTLMPNPYQDFRTVLLKLTATSTYGSGTSSLQVIDSFLTFSSSTGIATETTTNLENIAGGATTVAKTLDATPYGYIGDRGHRLLVRVNNSAAASAVTIYPYGLFWALPKEAAAVR